MKFPSLTLFLACLTIFLLVNGYQSKTNSEIFQDKLEKLRASYKNSPQMSAGRAISSSLLMQQKLEELNEAEIEEKLPNVAPFPCLNTKCHENALCKNLPFYAECECVYGFAGDGRNHCDECGITNFENKANDVGQRAIPYSWPATALISYTYRALVKVESNRILINDAGICGGVLLNRRHILTSANCLKRKFKFYDYASDTVVKAM
ncbi:unnamed protein product [Brachionus calyciflorus]|uniref:EGF-like domain-containing protein n=1 Tax=Brachionus calyciflorus TaxID=104777 RepID=A0A814C158_9BILA|nr:unnamed protein product [Brachionus calyciflorus]